MVSVIIPTLDAGSRLEMLLFALQKQSVPIEIVIIDSSSTDSTWIIAKDHNAKLISIEKKDFNHGATEGSSGTPC